LFLDAQISTLDISSSRELELAAGTTRYVSSANLKMRFPAAFKHGPDDLRTMSMTCRMSTCLV